MARRRYCHSSRRRAKSAAKRLRPPRKSDCERVRSPERLPRRTRRMVDHAPAWSGCDHAEGGMMAVLRNLATAAPGQRVTLRQPLMRPGRLAAGRPARQASPAHVAQQGIAATRPAPRAQGAGTRLFRQPVAAAPVARGDRAPCRRSRRYRGKRPRRAGGTHGGRRRRRRHHRRFRSCRAQPLPEPSGLAVSSSRHDRHSRRRHDSRSPRRHQRYSRRGSARHARRGQRCRALPGADAGQLRDAVAGPAGRPGARRRRRAW